MFNKNSNKNLWIVFAILFIAVILIFTTESTKNERSFRKELVSIDTSAITSFSIFPKSQNGKEVKFLKSDGIWNVSGESNKYFTVPKNKIKNLFDQLLLIKPKRVASKSKSKWVEYQVDSSATRVVINEGSSEVLNLVIGKFAFQQPRTMTTFVRLMNETDVYEVDGFLDMTFNKDVNSFRSETVVKSNKDNWNKITFTSTNSESFELVKVDNFWLIDGVKTDSIKTEKVLNSLARLTSTNFIDVAADGMLPPQTSKLIIDVTDGDPIEIIAYQSQSGDNYLIHSSQNIDNYFDGNKVADKIFIKKETLFN